MQFILTVTIPKSCVYGIPNPMVDFNSKQSKKHVPKPIQSVFMSYAGIEGSEVYDSFIQKRLIYKSATFKKPK